MRIDINEKYVITSDALQFIVATKGTYKTDQKDTKQGPGAKVGDEKLTPIGYVSTLEQCYIFLLRRQIRESDAVGFKEVIQEVRRIEKELKETIKLGD